MDIKANKISKTAENSLEHIYTSLLKICALSRPHTECPMMANWYCTCIQGRSLQVKTKNNHFSVVCIVGVIGILSC